jgi:hypothetical protein
MTHDDIITDSADWLRTYISDIFPVPVYNVGGGSWLYDDTDIIQLDPFDIEVMSPTVINMGDNDLVETIFETQIRHFLAATVVEYVIEGIFDVSSSYKICESIEEGIDVCKYNPDLLIINTDDYYSYYDGEENVMGLEIVKNTSIPRESTLICSSKTAILIFLGKTKLELKTVLVDGSYKLMAVANLRGSLSVIPSGIVKIRSLSKQYSVRVKC